MNNVEVVGFGIVVGVRQVGVIVMGKVRVLKPQIGDEQPQRRKDGRIAERSVAEGVAVQDLMLKLRV